MKSKKLQILEKILRWMAIRIIKKYKPKIVAITGSVGKTTTKEAVAHLLGESFSVRKNEKNYNNEVGVPLTIIGAKSGEGSVLRWLRAFLRWFLVYVFPVKYPKIIVLEMGADRPGDIKYLCDFVPIEVGVMTNVGISHLEFFKTKEALAKEKGTLLKKVVSDGTAICNQDDEWCKKIKEQLGTNVISYGLEQKADMCASDMMFGYQDLKTSQEGKRIQLVKGIIFKLNYQGKIVPIKLSHALGYPTVYATLAALAVGEHFKINAVEAARALENFVPPRGRMNLLAGIKNTAIVDDTYNSAPDSVKAALQTMEKMETSRKIAVMGDMLELGPEEENAHRVVGRWLAEKKFDFIITVGKRAENIFDEFTKANGNNQNQAHFENPNEAGKFLQNILREGDVVLVKGSQGMRMEKIVAEVMAEPRKKEELLVRQDPTWQEKPFQQP